MSRYSKLSGTLGAAFARTETASDPAPFHALGRTGRSALGDTAAGTGGQCGDDLNCYKAELERLYPLCWQQQWKTRGCALVAGLEAVRSGIDPGLSADAGVREDTNFGFLLWLQQASGATQLEVGFLTEGGLAQMRDSLDRWRGIERTLAQNGQQLSAAQQSVVDNLERKIAAAEQRFASLFDVTGERMGPPAPPPGEEATPPPGMTTNGGKEKLIFGLKPVQAGGLAMGGVLLAMIIARRMRAA